MPLPKPTFPVLRLIQRLYQIEKQTLQTDAPLAYCELIRSTRNRPIADKLYRFILGHLYTPPPHR